MPSPPPSRTRARRSSRSSRTPISSEQRRRLTAASRAPATGDDRPTIGHVGRANVELHRDGPIARVVLDRPDRRNALSLALMQDVIETLDDIAADTAARVV